MSEVYIIGLGKIFYGAVFVIFVNISIFMATFETLQVKIYHD